MSDDIPKIRIKTLSSPGGVAGGNVAAGAVSLQSLFARLGSGLLGVFGGIDGFCQELWRDFRRAKLGSPERARLHGMVMAIASKAGTSDADDYADEAFRAAIKAVAESSSSELDLLAIEGVSSQDLFASILDGLMRVAGGPESFCRELLRDFRKAKAGSGDRVRLHSMALSILSKAALDSDDDEADELLRAAIKTASGALKRDGQPS